MPARDTARAQSHWAITRVFVQKFSGGSPLTSPPSPIDPPPNPPLLRAALRRTRWARTTARRCRTAAPPCPQRLCDVTVSNSWLEDSFLLNRQVPKKQSAEEVCLPG